MKIIFTKKKLTQILNGQKNLGFVPTMGAIHKGHISLIKKSALLCNLTLVTIYINKPQFNEINDYLKYPKILKKDISILKKNKVDILYLPTAKQIYPKGTNKKIKVHPFGKQLCGKFRENYFEAVTDVIDRFIKIIKPNKIFFGNKDFQQLKVIEDFVKKNKIKTQVVGCKTIREKNGVAYSSRNLLLSSNQKVIASKIYKLIIKKKNNLIKKKMTIKQIKDKMFELGVNKIDYTKIIDINKLIKPYKKKSKFKIFIAYYLGSTRLIDNF